MRFSLLTLLAAASIVLLSGCTWAGESSGPKTNMLGEIDYDLLQAEAEAEVNILSQKSSFDLKGKRKAVDEEESYQDRLKRIALSSSAEENAAKQREALFGLSSNTSSTSRSKLSTRREPVKVDGNKVIARKPWISPVGARNPGATYCFMNAMNQAILHNPVLRQHIYNAKVGTVAHAVFAAHIYGLHTSYNTVDSANNMIALFKKLDWNSRGFDVGQQEDAGRYIEFIMDSVTGLRSLFEYTRECDHVLVGTYRANGPLDDKKGVDYSKLEYHPYAEPFAYRKIHEKQYFVYASLEEGSDLTNVGSLTDEIDFRFDYETSPTSSGSSSGLRDILIDGKTPTQLMEERGIEDKARLRVEHRYRVLKYPRIMLISTPFKPRFAKVIQMTDADGTIRKYHLISLIYHMGVHGAGHYVSKVRVSAEPEQWMRFSDESVTPIDGTEEELFRSPGRIPYMIYLNEEDFEAWKAGDSQNEPTETIPVEIARLGQTFNFLRHLKEKLTTIGRPEPPVRQYGNYPFNVAKSPEFHYRPPINLDALEVTEEDRVSLGSSNGSSSKATEGHIDKVFTFPYES